jgi:chromosome segregation ATPase
MTYDILINNLVNGEKVTVTSSDGTSYQEPRPPNRTALAAAKAIQNLQSQLSFSTNAIAQLNNERNDLYNNIFQLREQNKRLQDEINSKASSTVNSSGGFNNATTGDGGKNT